MTISRTAAIKIARRIVGTVCPVAAGPRTGTTYGFYVMMDPARYGSATTTFQGQDYQSALQKRREKIEEVVEAMVTGEQCGQETPDWYYAA